LKQITLLLLVIFVFAGCSSSRVITEFEFGNKLAKNGLWKEAYYRWLRALDHKKDKAAVYNNLAISLEFQGKLKESEAKYIEALKLSPANEYIKRNLSRLRNRINPEIKKKTSDENRLKKKKKIGKRSKE